jgi:hypothetical protein
MILGLTTLADGNIERVLSDPPLIWFVVAPEDPEMYQESRRQRSSASLLGRLFGKGTPPQPVAQLTLGNGEGISTDLDKAWHGIHYLLTRTAWEGEPPESFLVSGGRTVDDIDVGYGPARVFTAAETRAIRDTVAGLTDAELASRFDPDDMTSKEIYPEIWSRESADDQAMAYLLEYFAVLRKFLQQAVEAGTGMVVSLS